MVKDGAVRIEKDKVTDGRMANLDLLRSVAMLLVVVLHYLGKGELLGELTAAELTVTQTVGWFLEALAIVAVNVYMLISGYFVSTSSFKLTRLLKLWLQLEFYSVGIGMLSIVLGHMGWIPAQEVNTYFLLGLLFPVSMGHYWFMTAYIYLYILFALIGPVVKRMEKKQLQLVLFLLFFVFCFIKSFVPVHFELDELGYDCLWYLCMFLLGAYIRSYGFPILKLRTKWNCGALYLGACTLIFAGTMLLRQIYLRTGSLSYILKFMYDYNHIVNVLAALGLFGLFLYLRLPGRLGNVAMKLAPYTLGVYLLHENQGIRYAWQNLLGANRITTVYGLVLGVVIACVIVFITGVIVDFLRHKLMGALHRMLLHIGAYAALVQRLEACDRWFAGM